MAKSSQVPPAESWWRRPLFQQPTGAQIAWLCAVWLVGTAMLLLAVTDLFRDLSVSKLLAPGLWTVGSAVSVGKAVRRLRAAGQG